MTYRDIFLIFVILFELFGVNLFALLYLRERRKREKLEQSSKREAVK